MAQSLPNVVSSYPAQGSCFVCDGNIDYPYTQNGYALSFSAKSYYENLHASSEGMLLAWTMPILNLGNGNSIYSGNVVTPLSKTCKFFIRYM